MLGERGARFLNFGSQVVVLDSDVNRLQHLDEMLNGRVTTMLSTNYNRPRDRICRRHRRGGSQSGAACANCHHAQDGYRNMRPGAVFIDFSIDGGGVLGDKSPTTSGDQTYIVDGVIITAVRPIWRRPWPGRRSYGLTNSLPPYLLELGEFRHMGLVGRRPTSLPASPFITASCRTAKFAHALGRDIEITLTRENRRIESRAGGGKANWRRFIGESGRRRNGGIAC